MCYKYAYSDVYIFTCVYRSICLWLYASGMNAQVQWLIKISIIRNHWILRKLKIRRWEGNDHSMYGRISKTSEKRIHTWVSCHSPYFRSPGICLTNSYLKKYTYLINSMLMNLNKNDSLSIGKRQASKDFVGFLANNYEL